MRLIEKQNPVLGEIYFFYLDKNINDKSSIELTFTIIIPYKKHNFFLSNNTYTL